MKVFLATGEGIPYVLLSCTTQRTNRPNQMKITRKQLREMADAKGYIARKGSKTPKLRITEDGTIYRADVELSIARKMTLSEAAKCLA